jgi:quercetin dioxygenase-like cupin family protein
MENKIWGSKIRLLETSAIVVDLLTLEEDGICSWHYHDFKYNMFFVLEGIVEIKLESHCETLGIYDHYVVEPKIKHQFIAKSNGKMLEIMYTKPVLEGDIIREIQGGKIINGKFITENELIKRDLEKGINGMKEKDYD